MALRVQQVPHTRGTSVGVRIGYMKKYFSKIVHHVRFFSQGGGKQSRFRRGKLDDQAVSNARDCRSQDVAQLLCNKLFCTRSSRVKLSGTSQVRNDFRVVRTYFWILFPSDLCGANSASRRYEDTPCLAWYKHTIWHACTRRMKYVSRSILSRVSIYPSRSYRELLLSCCRSTINSRTWCLGHGLGLT